MPKAVVVNHCECTGCGICELARAQYYRLREWVIQDGIPRKDKLRELGLSFVGR